MWGILHELWRWLESAAAAEFLIVGVLAVLHVFGVIYLWPTRFMEAKRRRDEREHLLKYGHSHSVHHAQPRVRSHKRHAPRRVL